MNHIEPRKIIKFGNSSFVISLPISWVKENELSKGDLVYLQKNSNNELIIQPNNNSPDKNKEEIVEIIKCDGGDFETLRRRVFSAYLRGVTTIELVGDDIYTRRNEIKGWLDSLGGMVMLGHSNKKLILREFADANKISVKEFLGRINYILKNMFALLINGIENKTFEKTYEEIYSLDKDINRLHMLIWKTSRKIVSENSSTDKLKSVNIWWAAVNQEYIGDEIKRAARILKKKKFNKSELKDIHEICKTVSDFYEKSFHAYLEKDIDFGISNAKQRIGIFKIANKVSQKNERIQFLMQNFKTILRHSSYISKMSMY